MSMNINGMDLSAMGVKEINHVLDQAEKETSGQFKFYQAGTNYYVRVGNDFVDVQQLTQRTNLLCKYNPNFLHREHTAQLVNLHTCMASLSSQLSAVVSQAAQAAQHAAQTILYPPKQSQELSGVGPHGSFHPTKPISSNFGALNDAFPPQTQASQPQAASSSSAASPPEPGQSAYNKPPVQLQQLASTPNTFSFDGKNGVFYTDLCEKQNLKNIHFMAMRSIVTGKPTMLRAC